MKELSTNRRESFLPLLNLCHEHIESEETGVYLQIVSVRLKPPYLPKALYPCNIFVKMSKNKNRRGDREGPRVSQFLPRESFVGPLLTKTTSMSVMLQAQIDPIPMSSKSKW